MISTGVLCLTWLMFCKIKYQKKKKDNKDPLSSDSIPTN